MISDNVKKGATRCAHRSLFHANGYGPEDLNKPLIGICNSFNEIIPGHIHLREIAEAAKLGVAAAGGNVGYYPFVGRYFISEECPRFEICGKFASRTRKEPAVFRSGGSGYGKIV